MNADPKIEFAAILNLTAREYEIFQALGQGMTTRQIADLVGHRVERTTISSLQETIARKVGARDWRALFRMAVQYDYAGLKRVPLVPAPSQYKFVEASEPQRKDENERFVENQNGRYQRSCSASCGGSEGVV